MKIDLNKYKEFVDAVTSASVKNFKVTDLAELKQPIQSAKIEDKTFINRIF